MHTFCVAALTFVTGLSYSVIVPLWTPLLTAIVTKLLALIERRPKVRRETNHNWEKSLIILRTKLRQECIKS